MKRASAFRGSWHFFDSKSDNPRAKLAGIQSVAPGLAAKNSGCRSIPLKKIGIWIGFVFAVIAVAFVMSLIGIPSSIVGPVSGILVIAFIVIRSNNRKAKRISSADRDRLLAEVPPADYGFVYVHRDSNVGGLAVGFNVNLDNVDVAFLRLSRFTRLVVAPGKHHLIVGLKKQTGGIIANQQTAEVDFTLRAGETAVFGLKYGEGKMVKPLVIYRDAETGAALAKLAHVQMVAAEQTDALPQTAGSTQTSSS